MDNNKNRLFDDLIIKLLSNEINATEYEQLRIWLKDDRNKAYFDKYREIWQASGRTGGYTKFNSSRGWRKIKHAAGIPDETYITPDTKTRFKILKIAATIIILIAGTASITWYLTLKKFKHPNTPEITTITSPFGAKCKVVLPDSTEVWLNAGSKISYAKNFNDSERRLNLIGEAYFDVTANKEKPFLVQTSDILVRALGTKFNVKAYPEENEITTTLEEGIVDIRLINGKKTSEDIVLKPNEKVVYRKKSNELVETTPEKKADIDQLTIQKTEKIEINSNVKTELYTSWKDKRWIIEGENLESFVKILERRYNITIIFNDDELRTAKFTGIIENETIEQLMEALRLTSPLAFEINKDTINLHLDRQLEKKYKRFNIITNNP